MSLVLLERSGPVATLLLNRPEQRNALSIEMCREIVAALEGIRDEPGIRALVVAGEGTVFCAGADFAAVSGTGALAFLPAFEDMLEAVATFPLPTIAVIQGGAHGGGFQLASVCDLRVAEAGARLGIPSSRLGILVNFENVQRLVLLAGVAVAKEILMTARTYTGEQAALKGLVQRVVPDGTGSEAAHKLAQDVSSLAPLAVQGAKEAIAAVQGHLAGVRRHEPELIQRIDELVTRAYESDDLQEGLRAMSEKRKPGFKGS